MLTYDGSRSDVAINYALLFATGTLFIFGGRQSDAGLSSHSSPHFNSVYAMLLDVPE